MALTLEQLRTQPAVHPLAGQLWAASTCTRFPTAAAIELPPPDSFSLSVLPLQPAAARLCVPGEPGSLQLRAIKILHLGTLGTPMVCERRMCFAAGAHSQSALRTLPMPSCKPCFCPNAWLTPPPTSFSLRRRYTFGAPSCACAARSCSSTAARARTARYAPASANAGAGLLLQAPCSCTTCCSCPVQCKCQGKRYTLSRCSACCCPVRSATCHHAGCSRATRRSRPTPRLSPSRAAPPFHLPWCRRSGWRQHESGSPPSWNMPCLRCQLWPACGRS